MNPPNQWIVLILAASCAVVIGCFLLAWLDIAVHHHTRARPSQQEMRRFMLCGIYCNPDDRRPVVHRPMGRGYTLNLRRELLVVTLIVMAVLAMIAAALMYALPAAQ